MPLHLQYYEVLQALHDPRNPERPGFRAYGHYESLSEAREALLFLPDGSTIVQCRVVEVRKRKPADAPGKPKKHAARLAVPR